MQAEDGTMRMTDVADTEQLLRLIQSNPSPKAYPFKQWLAQVVLTELPKWKALNYPACTKMHHFPLFTFHFSLFTFHFFIHLHLQSHN
jgi:hypothetical protein